MRKEQAGGGEIVAYGDKSAHETIASTFLYLTPVAFLFYLTNRPPSGVEGGNETNCGNKEKILVVGDEEKAKISVAGRVKTVRCAPSRISLIAALEIPFSLRSGVYFFSLLLRLSRSYI